MQVGLNLGPVCHNNLLSKGLEVVRGCETPFLVVVYLEAARRRADNRYQGARPGGAKAKFGPRTEPVF